MLHDDIKKAITDLTTSINSLTESVKSLQESYRESGIADWNSTIDTSNIHWRAEYIEDAPEQVTHTLNGKPILKLVVDNVSEKTTIQE